MGNTPSFGRRVTPQRTEQTRAPFTPVIPVPNMSAVLGTAPAEPIRLSAADAFSPDIDREIEEWARARDRRVPWRQISLIASLSFAIAWFVLPDSVNDVVDWLLLALSGASLINGVRPGGKSYLAGAGGGAGSGGTNEPATPGNSTGLS